MLEQLNNTDEIKKLIAGEWRGQTSILTSLRTIHEPVIEDQRNGYHFIQSKKFIPVNKYPNCFLSTCATKRKIDADEDMAIKYGMCLDCAAKVDTFMSEQLRKDFTTGLHHLNYYKWFDQQSEAHALALKQTNTAYTTGLSYYTETGIVDEVWKPEGDLETTIANMNRTFDFVVVRAKELLNITMNREDSETFWNSQVVPNYQELILSLRAQYNNGSKPVNVSD